MNTVSNFGAGPLAISDVAARTGLTEAVLRAWERRYGFPRPEREAGTRRRYSPDEVARIERVVAERAAGRSIEAAIARVLADAGPLDTTVFAGLRRRHPGLVPAVLSRRAMLAISRAIEDEAAAHGDRAHFSVAFQRAAAYRRARADRWAALSRMAASTVVFADFARSRATAAGAVHEVALPAGSPQEREWALVCDGPRVAVVLAGWERPDGRFEAVWTVDPGAVRGATLHAHQLARQYAPRAPLPPPPAFEPVADPGVLDRAVAITNRVVAALDARRP